jgi:hypothetical protein
MANLNTFKPQSLTLTGNISVDNVIGNGSQLTNITGANIAGNVTSATTAYNGNVSTVSNNQEYRPLLATNTTGNLSFRASAGISWNPSTYALTAGKISLGGGIGAQGVTGIYAYGANTAWQVQSQNGTGTDAVGQEIGRFGSEYTSGATTYWDSYISYHQGSGSNSGWLKINAAGNTVANVTSTGISITGNISATVADATTLNTAASVGYLGMPQNSKSASYTLLIGDMGKHIYVTATGQTITIPANSSVAYPIGATIVIIAGPSATTVSIAITTDTMYLAGSSNTTGTRTLAQYAEASLVKVATDTWYISGVGIS